MRFKILVTMHYQCMCIFVDIGAGLVLHRIVGGMCLLHCSLEFLLRGYEAFVEVYLVGVEIAPDRGWECEDFRCDDSHSVDPSARCD